MSSQDQTITNQFSQRKRDHIEISLKPDSQSLSSHLDRVVLQHNPFPEINFEDVSLNTQFSGCDLRSPLFISSMTLGHDGAEGLNHILASAATQRGWMMGVGSQRRQLFDPEAHKECEVLRSKFPDLVLFGNIGLSQLISLSVDQVQALVESLGAQFMVVHTNPLQEAIQPEGTPVFKGGLDAIETLCSELSVPVVVKETGCGFSSSSLSKLKSMNLAAVDLSGRGGTHWGRVETYRQSPGTQGYKTGLSFNDWGFSTVESLQSAMSLDLPFEVWASGGVRSGVDAAKLLAMGATKIGLAQPILKAALQGEEILNQEMQKLETELAIAMFCMGIENLDQLIGNKELVQWV